MPELDDGIEERIKAEGGANDWLVYLAVHAVFLMLIVFVALYLAPRFAKMFEDLGEALPLISLTVISASYLLRAYWYAVPFVWAVLLGIDGAAMYWFHSTGRGKALRAWSIAVILLLTACIGLVILGFFLPLRQITRGLAQ